MKVITLLTRYATQRHPETSLTVIVALLVVVLSLLTTLLHTVGLVLRADVFLVMIAVVSFGGTTRWGIFLGFLVMGGMASDWTGGAVTGLAGLLTVLVLTRLWMFPDPRTDPGKWALLYGGTSLVAVIVYAAFVGALSDVAGRAPFYVGFLSTVESNIALGILSFPAAWPINRATVDIQTHSWAPQSVQPRRRLAVAVILLWSLGASLGSFMYRTVSVVPPARLHPVAESLLELSGPHGVRTVFMFNFGAAAVLWLLLYTDVCRDLSWRRSVPWS